MVDEGYDMVDMNHQRTFIMYSNYCGSGWLPSHVESPLTGHVSVIVATPGARLNFIEVCDLLHC